MKLKILRRTGMLIFFACMVGVLSAQAALNLKPVTVTNLGGTNISTSVLAGTSDLIDAYFSAPAMPGNPATRTTDRLNIAKDKPTYDLSPSSYQGYISGGNAIFFLRDSVAETSSLNDSSVKLRIWSSLPNQENGYYSLPQTFANSETGGVDTTFSAQTNYKAAKPYRPNITRFDATTTMVLPSRTVTGTLRVTSAPRPVTDGNREITTYSWKMGTSSTALSSVAGASSVLELDASTLTPGTRYYFEATHGNWFGSEKSDIEYYDFAGTDGGVVTRSITYPLRVSPSGLKLNAVAVLHDVPFRVDTTPTATSVGTIAELVAAINTKSTRRDNVTAIGWMENSEMKGFYVTYSSAGVPTFTPTAGLSTTASQALVRGRSYQISVNSNVDVTFQ